MKRIIVTLAVVSAMTGIVTAFITGVGALTWPPYTPLPVAYNMAMTTMGSATNEFLCIEVNHQSFPGWTFTFANTNAVSKVVTVPDGKEPKCEIRDVTK
jgi:hypothetical protein